LHHFALRSFLRCLLTHLKCAARACSNAPCLASAAARCAPRGAVGLALRAGARAGRWGSHFVPEPARGGGARASRRSPRGGARTSCRSPRGGARASRRSPHFVPGLAFCRVFLSGRAGRAARKDSWAVSSRALWEANILGYSSIAPIVSRTAPQREWRCPRLSLARRAQYEMPPPLAGLFWIRWHGLVTYRLQ
jgi:hypothetical protein